MRMAADMGDTIVVSIATDSGTTRAFAHVSPNGTVSNLAPASEQRVRDWYAFNRATASYMLFNELMGSDTIVPRHECAALIHVTLETSPPLRDELVAAMLHPPAQEPAVLRDMRGAWLRFVGGSAAGPVPQRALNEKTIAAVGPSPPIRLVYRDVDTALRSGDEYDVVRIGGARHTYAQVYRSSDGSAAIQTSVLCVTGDHRCASWYPWP